jgi:hypothetical protein
MLQIVVAPPDRATPDEDSIPVFLCFNFLTQRGQQDLGRFVEHDPLMGHSAGAYIAAMLAFDPQWLRQVGLKSRTDLAGFIGLMISCQSRAESCAPFSAAPIGRKRSRSPSSPVRKRPHCYSRHGAIASSVPRTVAEWPRRFTPMAVLPRNALIAGSVILR